MKRTLSPRRASAYNRYTVRGVDHATIGILAGLLRVSQGDIVNTAVQKFVGHLRATGKLPEAIAKCLKNLEPPSASDGGH